MSSILEKAIDNFPNRPHLVILGAGASKDAMPDGDVRGKQLPVMKEFISTMGITEYVRRIDGVPKTDDIEEVKQEAKWQHNGQPDNPTTNE